MQHLDIVRPVLKTDRPILKVRFNLNNARVQLATLDLSGDNAWAECMAIVRSALPAEEISYQMGVSQQQIRDWADGSTSFIPGMKLREQVRSLLLERIDDEVAGRPVSRKTLFELVYDPIDPVSAPT